MHGIDVGATEHIVWRAAVEHFNEDPILGSIVKKIGLPKITVVTDPFEALARGIIHQQVSAKAAEAMAAKLAEKNGGTFPTAGQVLTMGPKAIQEAGLPERRAVSLWKMAKVVSAGAVAFDKLSELSDDEVRAELIKLPGIGPWTANMFLVFHMMREDVWSTDDIALQKAVKQVFDLGAVPTADEMNDLAKNWRPYRSAAAWYLWRATSGFTPGLR